MENKNLTCTTGATASLSDIDKKIISDLLTELQGIFPAWRQAFGTQREIRNVQKVWAKALISCNLTDWAHIERGLNQAKQSGSAFFPSVGDFISWCVPVPRFAISNFMHSADTRERNLSQYGVSIEDSGYLFGRSPTQEAIKNAFNARSAVFKI